jgi:hypothetical protein
LGTARSLPSWVYTQRKKRLTSFPVSRAKRLSPHRCCGRDRAGVGALLASAMLASPVRASPTLSLLPNAPTVAPIKLRIIDWTLAGSVVAVRALDWASTGECLRPPWQQCHEGEMPTALVKNKVGFAADEAGFQRSAYWLSARKSHTKERGIAKCEAGRAAALNQSTATAPSSQRCWPAASHGRRQCSAYAGHAQRTSPPGPRPRIASGRSAHRDGRPLILVARLETGALSLCRVSTVVPKHRSVEFNPVASGKLSEVGM